MATRQRKKSRLAGFVIPCFAAALLAYFAYHAQTGKYGIHAMREMDQKAVRLRYELGSIRKERERMQKKVALLTDGTLEADALDENARQILGMASAGEVVILYY